MAKDDMAAFPFGGEHRTNLGMTLRDYFAAKHLQGVSGDSEMWRAMCLDTPSGSSSVDYIAYECYKMADAMMKARNK
jgi:hypothetical protein